MNQIPTLTPISGHFGKMMFWCANNYPTLVDVMLEGIQNCLDSNATRIDVHLDLKDRTLVIADNGIGASYDKFYDALNSIGVTMKKDNKLGRFGFGLIAPLGKCQSFTFTSVEAGSEAKGYLRWTFLDSLKDQKEIEGIPCESMPNFEYSPDPDAQPRRGKNLIWWRAQIKVKGIINDRALTRFDIEEFTNEVLGNFRKPMYRNGVKVSLRYTNPDGHSSDEKDISAEKYEGRQLEVYTHETKSSGVLTASLFLALNTTGRGRSGEVLFGAADDEFRIPTRVFLNSVRGKLTTAAEQAIASGVFEGDIVCENVSLHVNRKGFILDDALDGMCVSLEKWFDDVGKKYVEEFTSRDNVKRWQVIGTMAMKNIEDNLRDQPEFKDIYDKITLGTTGKGHKKVAVVGEQEDTSITTRAAALKNRPEETENEDDDEERKERDRKPPKKDLPKHRPNTIAGPLGDVRKVVKGNSTGLQFKFVELASITDIYDFDIKTGLLQFNTTHKYWIQLSNRDIMLMKYLEAVTRMAICLVQYQTDGLNYKSCYQVLARNLSMEVKSILNEGVTRQRMKEYKKWNLVS